MAAASVAILLSQSPGLVPTAWATGVTQTGFKCGSNLFPDKIGFVKQSRQNVRRLKEEDELKTITNKV